jgi:hypothetical protein|tara:strand:+ start:5813 stop:7261 length:1449 start_codon:yes stop_codon:yes gene_type:complete
MADGRQILEIVMGGSGAAAAGGVEGGSGSGKSENALSSMAKKLGMSTDLESETAKGTTGMAKKFDGFIKNQLGISFNLANILKQSQIFTSFVGTIFQLMGALVDVILAPFLPVLIPVITKVASWIPWVQQKAQEVANFLFSSFAWIGKQWENATQIWNKVNEFLEPVKNVVGQIWDKVTTWASDLSVSNIGTSIGRIWDTASTAIKGFFEGVWTKFKNWGDDVGKKVDDVPEGIWKFLGRGITWALRKGGMMLDNVVKGLLGALPLGSIWKLMYSLAKAITKFLSNAALMLVKLLLKLGKWLITSGVPAVVRGLKSMFGKIAENIWNLIKKIGAKLPFGMDKAFKSLGGNMPLVGKVLKRLPVVGTAAQLGFGAVETYRATKKYGLQAGLAFGAKNLAATAASVVPVGGTVGAAAIDIGGTIALTKYYDAQLAKKEAEKTQPITIIQQDANGQDMQTKHFRIQGQEKEIRDSYERDGLWGPG